MDYQFHKKGKFALLTVSDVFARLPAEVFQLSDGTWVMDAMPVPDLGIWKEWLGSIRVDRLSRATLILLVEEPSDNPAVLDDVHERLALGLRHLYYMLHLHAGIETADGADVFCGSSENGVTEIRQASQMPDFYQSEGWQGVPITKDWLEDCAVLRDGWAAMGANKIQFRRVVRGLNVLFKGLQEKVGQDRIHQFVRSLEALILPDVGKTKKQFVHRCQTFASLGNDTCGLLEEAFDMRSDTEHLNPWDGALQRHRPNLREDVGWERTRQMEHLACDAYSRLMRDPALCDHFRTDDAIATFRKFREDDRQALWGTPLDIRVAEL